MRQRSSLGLDRMINATAVFKFGGSLLEPPHLQDLPARLESLLGDRELAGPRPVVLCGGGAVVDVLRELDRVHGVGEERSHWIAVRALGVTSTVFEALLPGTRVVEELEDCRGVWERGEVPIVDALAFLTRVDERRRDPLPRRWAVTSDSIAARLASALGARRLVLVKSTTIPGGLALEGAVEAGYVDSHFAVAARGLAEIVAINLRELPPAVSHLR